MQCKRLYTALTCLSSLILPLSVSARPVSYPEAWTLMIRNDADQNSIHAHYTIDTQHSLGLRVRHDRDRDFTFIGGKANRLMKRWNKPDSQANLYARFALGAIIDDADEIRRLKRENDVGIFFGLSGDWETRRYFISGAAEHWDNGRFGEYSAYHTRLGIAPYVANTGALHTWLMIEGHHNPEDEKKLGASALVRLFKGLSLLELGLDADGQPLLNYIHRY